jgi:hypothetical protein
MAGFVAPGRAYRVDVGAAKGRRIFEARIDDQAANQFYLLEGFVKTLRRADATVYEIL